jgi:hypothetical protein
MNNRKKGRIVVCIFSLVAAATMILTIAFVPSRVSARTANSPTKVDTRLELFDHDPSVANLSVPLTPSTESLDSGVGWALTTGGLEVTANSGTTFQILAPPVAVSDISDVSIEGEQVTVASVDDGIVTVVSSSNFGSLWSSVAINTDQPDAANAQIVTNLGTVLGIFISNQSDSNSSSGEWYSASSNGSWIEHDAPAGGSATYLNGALWLVGGPVRTELFVSGNNGSSWNAVTAPSSTASSESALSIPGQIDGSSVVLVATTSPQTSTQGITETVYTSNDLGGSWNVLGTSSFVGDVGVGVPSPTEVVGNQVWIANPGGLQIEEFTSAGVASQEDVNATGDEPVIGALSGGSSTLNWATILTTECPSGKSSCTEISTLYSQSSSGWSPVQLASAASS